MSTNSQALRAAQLLFNHGPGSILETVNGPTVVRTWGTVVQAVDRAPVDRHFPSDFEIHEHRLAAQLTPTINDGRRCRLHRIPSNAELSLPESRYIVDTNRFPAWLLCNRTAQHETRQAVLYQHGTAHRANCPICSETGHSIRFVAFCNAGHMDDVSWRYLLHGGRPPATCESEVIFWRETSTSMQGIELTCRGCPSSESLGDLAVRPGPCSGRSPESEQQGPFRAPGCDRQVKITQRQSTVLWQSVSQRVISVPEESSLKAMISQLCATQIGRGLSVDRILAKGERVRGEPELERVYREYELSPPSDPGVESILGWMADHLHESTPPHKLHIFKRLFTRIRVLPSSSEFEAAWRELTRGAYTRSAIESLQLEFNGLVNSERPTQVQEHEDPDSKTVFKMEGHSGLASFGRLQIKAEAIELLRSVTALTGYARGAMNTQGNRPAPEVQTLAHHADGDDWYAAAEAFGEGLLLTLDSESTDLVPGERWSAWDERHAELVTDAGLPEPQSTELWRQFRSAGTALRMDAEWRPEPGEAGEFLAESHPLFVWWHTFAHQFIRAVQAETGYSSASMVERVYAVPSADGVWRGAALIYVTEGGMDGTLGGLTALLPHMDTFLGRMESEGIVCSNDPLCEDGTISPLPQVGCYACVLNPETSCEHRNMFLDRLLLFEAAGI